jgi:hypothetical protein
MSHLDDVGESYWEHFRCAWKLGFRMVIAGAACMVHSIFPNRFINTASAAISHIHAVMQRRNKLTMDNPDDRFPDMGLLLKIVRSTYGENIPPSPGYDGCKCPCHIEKGWSHIVPCCLPDQQVRSNSDSSDSLVTRARRLRAEVDKVYFGNGVNRKSKPTR